MKKLSKIIKSKSSLLRGDKNKFIVYLLVLVFIGGVIIYAASKNSSRESADQHQVEVTTELPSDEVLEEVNRTLESDINNLPVGRFDPSLEENTR